MFNGVAELIPARPQRHLVKRSDLAAPLRLDARGAKHAGAVGAGAWRTQCRPTEVPLLPHYVGTPVTLQLPQQVLQVPVRALWFTTALVFWGSLSSRGAQPRSVPGLASARPVAWGRSRRDWGPHSTALQLRASAWCVARSLAEVVLLLVAGRLLTAARPPPTAVACLHAPAAFPTASVAASRVVPTAAASIVGSNCCCVALVCVDPPSPVCVASPFPRVDLLRTCCLLLYWYICAASVGATGLAGGDHRLWLFLLLRLLPALLLDNWVCHRWRNRCNGLLQAAVALRDAAVALRAAGVAPARRQLGLPPRARLGALLLAGALLHFAARL